MRVSIKKRAISFLIDCFFLFVLLFVVGFYYFKINIRTSNYQMASFVLISSLFVPLDTLYRLFFYPRTFGVPQVYFGMFAVLFAAEWLFWCVQETVSGGCTIGKKWTSLRTVRKDGKQISVKTIMIRNLIKTVSRYCFSVPMFIAVFSKEQQTLHDLIAKTYVISE